MEPTESEHVVRSPPIHKDVVEWHTAVRQALPQMRKGGFLRQIWRRPLVVDQEHVLVVPRVRESLLLAVDSPEHRLDPFLHDRALSRHPEVPVT